MDDMQVDWNEQIAGLRIISVRNVLRKLRSKPFCALSLSRIACLSVADTEHLIHELSVRGWIEPDLGSTEPDDWTDTTGVDKSATIDENMNGDIDDRERVGQRFVITDEGIRLTTKKVIRRVLRGKAESLLNGVVIRATDINERSDLTHYVKELRVFGSYLGDSSDLGDVDIAASIILRGGVSGGALIAYAKASGKYFRNFVEELTYGYTQVRRILKNRSPIISLHDISDLEALECDSTTVFSADDPGGFVEPNVFRAS
jgi:hypothetical protein